MQSYKIIIAYDGTNFSGWQQQQKDLTVQSCLTKSFEHAFKSNAKILAASRTDSGVHALGQVARVITNINMEPETLKLIWNRSLPKSILIRSIQRADKEFYPLRNVDYKIYYYHLFLKQPLPFISRFGWYYKFINKVDFKKFEAALKLYLGEHDFASFCKLEKNDNKTTIRKIDKIFIKRINKFNVIRIEIKGKSFLRFQIRRMIGYALDVARRPELPLDYLQSLLKNPNPKQTLLKADGCGLCLRKVKYKNEDNIKK
ncbi:MAG: tRNA pseudouridine(38-40) synthase TruA [bacterium]